MEVDTSTTHPNPIPNPHHRKIEVQSPLDLTYLQSNLAASARQKLDLHFPPSASQPAPSEAPSSSNAQSDPMRQRVQDLVSQFLDRTWTAAKQSIAINGQDAAALPQELPMTDSATVGAAAAVEEREGVDFNYEPYDARLSGRVASLHGELEALTAQVSRLRRTAPRAAAEGYQQALQQALAEDQKAFEARRDEVEKSAAEVRGLKLDSVRPGWEADVTGMYERGLSELRRLGGHADAVGPDEGSGSLTETVGKAQRAKVVAMEFE